MIPAFSGFHALRAVGDLGKPLWYISTMQKAILIVIVLAAVLVIGWALWPTGDEVPPPEPETTDVSPPPATPRQPATPQDQPRDQPLPQTEPEVVVPPLEDSDAFVRERLEPLDLPEPWIEQSDLVRRLAVAAENATRGEYPRRQLAFLAPRGQFKVEERNERIFLDPQSYDRYDRYVEEIESVDPARLAGVLRTLDPLVEDALVEVGVEAPPGEVFEAAIREVLEVPVLEGDGRVELIQPNVMYQYADPELESLSPLKKQVLRMGPENVQRLQGYLRRLAAEMGMDIPP